MSGDYTYPEDAVHWQIVDNQLLLVTEDTDDTDEPLESIGESVTEGLLIEYYGNPDLLDPEDPEIHQTALPVSPRVHSGIQEYILSRLYAQKPEKDAQDVQMANWHFNLAKEKIYRLHGGKPKPRGARRIIPSGPGAVK